MLVRGWLFFLAAPVCVFAACPSIGFSAAQVTNLGAPGGAAYSALLRQLDGTFTLYQAGAAAPYAVQSGSPNSLGAILPCGIAAPAASPFGGAAALLEALTQTGAASQTFAFTATPANVGIMAFVPANSGSVRVYTATTSLPLGAKSATSYPAGALAAGVIFADLNGDGNPDMIVADTGSQTDLGGAVVFLGSPSGTFQAPATYTAHGAPAAIAAADFNHDGNVDLAVANHSTGDVTVLLGRGDGTFLQPRTYAALTNASSVAAADLNRDGKLDLAVVGSGGSIVALLGNGDGTFQAPTRAFPAAGPMTNFVALGDFNADGIPDAAVASGQASAVAILLGNGDGSFGAPASYPVAAQPSSLIVTDINGDGSLDILAATGTPYLIAGGHADGQVSVLLGNGDGSFRAGSLAPAGLTPVSVAAADFNIYGAVDVVTANQSSNDLSYIAGRAGGGFEPAISIPIGSGSSSSAQPSAVITADFNRDRRPDLAVADYGSGDVVVMLGTGLGTFESPIRVTAGNNPTSIAVADFNNDGNPDMAVANLNSSGIGNVMVFTGAGGGFRPPVVVSAGSHPIAVAAADFNHDGRMDLAVISTGTFGADAGGVYVLLGNGDGSFQPAVDYPAGLNPFALAVADFNRDGNPDVAVLANASSPGSSLLTILTGSASGAFTALPPMAIAASAQSIGAADFNGDGKPDLVVSHGGAAQPGLGALAGNGDGTFQPETFTPSGPGAMGLTIADFNQDNRPDVAIALSGAITPTGNGAALVLLNQSPAPASTVNAASFASGAPVAPASIASVFGANLATRTETPPPPLGDNVAGTTVTVTGADGVARPSSIFYVSPGQVNYLVPAATPSGATVATIASGNGSISSSPLTIAAIAPGIFAANSSGLAAATLLRVEAGGSQSAGSVDQLDPSTGQIVPVPIDLDPSTGTVYLELYGTGLRGAASAQVLVQIGGLTLKPTYSGPQGAYAGLDQINIALPYSLKGSGNVTVTVSAAGVTANTVHVTIQ